MNEIEKLEEAIENAYRQHTSSQVFTVAISGIDGSGKGYISNILERSLTKKGYNVANINLDPWQNPMAIRLNEYFPEQTFYDHVFRWKDVFNELVIPLKQNGDIHLESKLIRNDSDEYYAHTYHYNKTNIILLDAIFLFKKELLAHYDHKVWIDCSFETALRRALSRNQEGLDACSLIHDYHTYYYPAQQYHFERDDPRTAANIIFMNN